MSRLTDAIPPSPVVSPTDALTASYSDHQNGDYTISPFEEYDPDRRIYLKPEFPLKQTLVLCLCKVAEAAVICFIMPFVNQMVASFGSDPVQSARYSGLIESSLIITEAIFSPFWGAMADKYGRKPLLVFGLAAFTVACLSLGFSRTLTEAILARSIGGVLGAVSVLVRTVQFEIVDEEDTLKVLNYMTPCWAIGAAIGPMIGGAFASPHVTMPKIFDTPFWLSHPYLLPSIVVSLLPAMAALGCYAYLPETLNRNLGNVPVEDEEKDQGDNDDASSTTTAVEEPSILDIIRAPGVAYALGCSALLSLVSMAYNAGFTMMAGAPTSAGGLAMHPYHIGCLLAISSGFGVLAGTHIVPFLLARFHNWYAVLRTASFAHALLFPLIALASVVARLEGGFGPGCMAIVAVVLVCYEIGETSFTGVDVAVADRAPPGCLGRINGLSMTIASLGRVIAPILTGQLWSLNLALPQPSGTFLVWGIFSIVAAGWHISTLRLFSPAEQTARPALLPKPQVTGSGETAGLLAHQHREAEHYGAMQV